jgi:hypothetical protein
MTRDEILQAIRAHMNDTGTLEELVEAHFDLRKQVEESVKDNIDLFTAGIEAEAREEALAGE